MTGLTILAAIVKGADRLSASLMYASTYLFLKYACNTDRAPIAYGIYFPYAPNAFLLTMAPPRMMGDVSENHSMLLICALYVRYHSCFSSSSISPMGSVDGALMAKRWRKPPPC